MVKWVSMPVAINAYNINKRSAISASKEMAGRKN